MSINAVLFWALLETLYMVFISGGLAVLLGLPTGVALHLTRHNGLRPHALLHSVISIIVDILRSVPFIILIVALIPFTRIIVGTSVGVNAAVVPLTIGAAPFVARIVANALLDIPAGLLDAGQVMGATTWQLIKKVLLPESFVAIINGITLMLVTLVGYSAMAGAVGAGGLGQVAIDYGYQRFNTTVMLSTVVVLVILVQVVQWLGDKLAASYARYR